MMPLTRKYRTDIISHDLRRLGTKFYMDMMSHKAKSVSGCTCDQIFIDGEGIFGVMPLFGKAEVGMELGAFAASQMSFTSIERVSRWYRIATFNVLSGNSG